MDKRTLDIAAYAASGMTPEQYKATGGYRNIFGEAGAMVGDNIIKFAKAQKNITAETKR